MAHIRFSIIVTALIALVVGAGVAYVGIPTVQPDYNTNSTGSNAATQTKTLTQQVTQTVTQVQSQTGVTNETYKSWQDESYIYDSNLQWSLMNQTQMNFTVKANSKINAQFSAPFLLSVDPTFSGSLYFVVSLVIQASNNTVVGNTTTPIIYYNGAASGYYLQQNYSPTLTVMTTNLQAGTYNCSVQWRSTIDATGSGNNLSVSHHNTNSKYHYDRWMLLQEIQG